MLSCRLSRQAYPALVPLLYPNKDDAILVARGCAQAESCRAPSVAHGSSPDAGIKKKERRRESRSLDRSCYILRRGRDSNPRNAFGVYTLSRRASSTTRAPLLISLLKASTHWKAPQRYNNICILPNCHVFSSRLGYLWQTLPKGALMGVVVDSTEQDCVNQYRSAG